MRIVIAEDLLLLREGMVRLLTDTGTPSSPPSTPRRRCWTPPPNTGPTCASWTSGCHPASATKACARRWSRAPTTPRRKC